MIGMKSASMNGEEPLQWFNINELIDNWCKDQWFKHWLNLIHDWLEIVPYFSYQLLNSSTLLFRGFSQWKQ